MSGAGAAFLRQSQALAEWASGLAPAEWAAPSALPNWTVRDLVAHLVIVHESLARTLGADTDGAAMPLGAYVSTYSAHAEELERLAQDRAASVTPAELVARLVELREALAGSVVATAPAVLASARGPVSREDFLRTRVVEATVHSDDLARSLPGRPGPALDPDALATTVGVLLEALAEQRPGSGQRVAVPGVAAVEVAGAAGDHELDPLVALRVFTGRLDAASLDATRTDPTWGPVLA